ncbi:MAG: hypothetical protein ACLFV7_10860 [Phycisphaerae bacterium]
MDITDSRDVFVSDCNIIAGDDANRAQVPWRGREQEQLRHPREFPRTQPPLPGRWNVRGRVVQQHRDGLPQRHAAGLPDPRARLAPSEAEERPRWPGDCDVSMHLLWARNVQGGVIDCPLAAPSGPDVEPLDVQDCRLQLRAPSA